MAAKRVSDLVILTLAHVLLLPLWIVLWTAIPLAVWLSDRGSVFYKQPRVGRHGTVFTVLKFRTMVPHPDQLGQVVAQHEDPRITRVGRILRKTALDELPQVLNIWKGDMSFVGPRPEQPAIHAKIVRELPDFRQRLVVRPGLTGMAQVYGEYFPPPSVKLSYDLQYIENMSLWLDLRLLFASVRRTILANWDLRPPRPQG